MFYEIVFSDQILAVMDHVVILSCELDWASVFKPDSEGLFHREQNSGFELRELDSWIFCPNCSFLCGCRLPYAMQLEDAIDMEPLSNQIGSLFSWQKARTWLRWPWSSANARRDGPGHTPKSLTWVVCVCRKGESAVTNGESKTHVYMIEVNLDCSVYFSDWISLVELWTTWMESSCVKSKVHSLQENVEWQKQELRVLVQEAVSLITMWESEALVVHPSSYGRPSGPGRTTNESTRRGRWRDQRFGHEGGHEKCTVGAPY